MLERYGRKTVIDASFDVFSIQQNKSIYPIKHYQLRNPVDSAQFINLGYNTINGLKKLRYDPS